MRYEAVVIGASTGGIDALREIIVKLKKDLELPVLVVQHTSPYSENYLVKILNEVTELNVKEAEEKEKVEKGNIYLAPPNYHMMVEMDKSISFDSSEKVCFSRPSIDVLFETAAEVYRDRLIGVILTGANYDGAEGLNYIKKCGGTVLVQTPEESEVDIMPLAAIRKTGVEKTLGLQAISEFLNNANS